MEQCYYVYVIFRPNGEPCYVGKGKRFRWTQHAKGSHNLHLRRIYEAANGDLPIVKVRENLTDAEACKVEIALILAIGRGKNGPLVNFTDGGNGVSGHIQSEETRQKKREKLLGRPRPPHVVEAVRLAAQNRTPQWYENQRKTHLGFVMPQSTKNKISAALKGRIFSEKHRANLSASGKGKIISEEQITKTVAANTANGHYANLAERNKDNKYGIGNKRTPEGQARVTAAVALNNSKRVATEEYREKRRAIAKAMWTRRKATTDQ
jgi:hypothetical protein